MDALNGAAEDAARLAALQEYGFEKGFSDPALDRLMRLAAAIFAVPIAVISLPETERELFIASFGLRVTELPYVNELYGTVAREKAVIVVPDARLDPRLANSPLVARPPHLRFYALAPLIAPSGHALGALFLHGVQPRDDFDERAVRNLKDLAALALERMEARRLDLARRSGRPRFEEIAANSPAACLCVDVFGHICFWNQAAERITGYRAGEVLGRAPDLIAPRRVLDSLRAVVTAGGPELNAHVIEIDITRKNGGDVPIELTSWKWREGRGTAFGAVLRVVAERRANEERLYRLADLDPLTALPNRARLRNRIERAISRNFAATVMRIDISGLKDINDDLGLAFGDAVIIRAAERIASLLRPKDVVARLGGNEFAVVVAGLGAAEDAVRLADTLIEGIAALTVVEDQPIQIAAHAGVALFPDHATDADALLSGAELALFQAKSESRHGRRLFSPDLKLAAVNRRALQNELRRAYDQHEFELFYQPQIRLADGALAGAEALLRWRHPEKGLLTPGVFLPAVEAGPLAVLLGGWVIRTACVQAAAWRAAGAGNFLIAANLFGAQFHAGDLALQVGDILSETGLAASALELEITENIILSEEDAILGTLHALRKEGVGITFDDYGTGYASFSMLKRFPVTRLKIDRSFVQSMCESSPDSAIVRAILYLGRSFGLGVIAEGVETTEQSQMLRRKGCEQVQGFLTGRPMPAPEFARRFGLAGGTSDQAASQTQMERILASP